MSEAARKKVRLDRWLWAVRLFKTRSLAVEGCRSGHVKIEGEPVKPSRPVREGEVITVQQGAIRRVVRVIGLLEKRVGAKLAPDFVEDLTPPEEYEKLKETLAQRILKRDRGEGRPTKKDRRQIEKLLGESGFDVSD